MALTPERIRELWENYSPTKGIESFARSVEAEVRKDDEALIRQLESALSWSSPHADADHGWKSEDWARKRSEAITAARARLGTNPPPGPNVPKPEA